jgi:CRISPR-associated protein Csb2
MSFFGPNNDLDTIGGDIARVAEIRVPKTVEPRLFDVENELLYAWPVTEDQNDAEYAEAVRRLSERLYQLGRGVDMAWAHGQIMDDAQLAARFARHRGPVYRPSSAGTGRSLRCPQPGSLESLELRYKAVRRRLLPDVHADRVLFRQPPKARFAQVAYENRAWRRVYELRDASRETRFFAYRTSRATTLLVWLRDEAARRLRDALPDRGADIERILIGRKHDGADAGPISARIRIVPLPSVGHLHADQGIRRVLVEVPSGASLRAEDVDWALSGAEHVDATTGEIQFSVVPARDDRMLRNFTSAGRVWQTVTAAALPYPARRRRIDPARVAEEAKGGRERAEEEARAAAAVVQALRHVEVRARPARIRVQREPFERHGERAEMFAGDTRFPKERLWHVEIEFDRRVAGPLVIGDGRFLGLGVMAPVSMVRGLNVFAIESGLVATPDPVAVARALRRAVMARVQQVLGTVRLPTFFSGHDRDGFPVRSEGSAHLAFVFDPTRSRLLVVAPHVLDRRDPTSDERSHLMVLDEALEDLEELRAGPVGCLALRSHSLDAEADALVTPSRIWESVNPYLVTRHAKKTHATEVLTRDLRAECRRHGLPAPVEVRALEMQGVSGVGLVARARLVFAVAVNGPILVGRNRFLGGGLFCARDRDRLDAS